jgi:hypothetical protein
MGFNISKLIITQKINNKSDKSLTEYNIGFTEKVDTEIIINPNINETIDNLSDVFERFAEEGKKIEFNPISVSSSEDVNQNTNYNLQRIQNPNVFSDV